MSDPLDELRHALCIGTGEGVARLLSEARSLVLFGSRAVGMASRGSDWDLLCVGSGDRRCSPPGFDLVWVREPALSSDRWLGSELAGHVARYGIWVHGDPWWARQTFVSSEAIQRKLRQIECRLEGLGAAWRRLSWPYRSKHQRFIRLNLQRLDLLVGGQSVPPRPLLERAWNECGNAQAELARLREVWERERSGPRGTGTRRRQTRSLSSALIQEILSSMAELPSGEDASEVRRGEDPSAEGPNMNHLLLADRSRL